MKRMYWKIRFAFGAQVKMNNVKYCLDKKTRETLASMSDDELFEGREQ